MSVIGKNIRKIRNFHKLNQTQFAELFDLKRANIGSYEEERAEPKTDSIIDIAKKFSVNLEALLTKELTINDISHIDKRVHDQVIQHNHNTEEEILPTLFVHSHQQEEYINTGGIKTQERLRFPIPQNFNSRAFQVSKHNITELNPFRLAEGTIVIGSQSNKKFISKLPLNDCYVTVTKTSILIDSLEKTLKSVVIEDIKELWTVIGKYQTDITPSTTTRLHSLEKRIEALEEKL